MRLEKMRKIGRIVPRIKYELKSKRQFVVYQRRNHKKKTLLDDRLLKLEQMIHGSAVDYVRENMRPVLAPYGFDDIISCNDLHNDIIKSADNVMNDRFYILHDYRTVTQMTPNHYLWNEDVLTGYVYDSKYYKDYTNDLFHPEQGQTRKYDLKGPWELSRLQYLVAPALAWKLTGKDFYAQKVVNILTDWIESNQVCVGPNWNCAMESGIRAVNMLMAFQIIRDFGGLTDSFCRLFVTGMQIHLESILDNLENYAGRTYNHYLGDIIGILAIVASFPFLKDAEALYSKYRLSFEKEIRKQVLSDGGSFEGSTCYHCLVGEIFTLAAVIIQNHGEAVTDEYEAIINKMMSFSQRLQKPVTGLQPQIGDDDGGRVIEIIPHDSLDYSWFINMASAVIGMGFIDDDQRALQSFFVQENEKCSVANKRIINESSFCFPDFGIVGYKDSHLYCLLSATEAQRYGLGGHTHNDKLSVEISIDGVDFLVDPGSGTYTSDFQIHIRLRSVFSHTGVIVNGREQNISQCGTFFGNSHETECHINNPKCGIDRVNLNGNIQVTGSNGYRQERTVSIFNKNHIVIIDNVSTKTKNISDLRLNFALAPDVEVHINGDVAMLYCKGITLQIRTEGASWQMDDSLYSPAYGITTPSHIVYSEFNVDSLTAELVTVVRIENNKED